MSLNSKQIEECFHHCFFNQYNTVLVGGFDKPFYQASRKQEPAQIQFRADYPRSALHEIAHWCVAGAQRRTQDDFGYWYRPDGRNLEEQKEFFIVEIKPQAYEWIFCEAAGLHFEVSLDNLDIDMYLLIQEQTKIFKKVNEFKEFTLAQANKTRVIQFSKSLQITLNNQ